MFISIFIYLMKKQFLWESEVTADWVYVLLNHMVNLCSVVCSSRCLVLVSGTDLV